VRAGIGFDVHRFDPSRALILGGVRIPEGPGLAGHSDADVLTHAVADAVLGAAGLGDIGEHFPDTDEQWRGVSSIDLLERVAAMLDGHVVSVDATVLIEEPKLRPYRAEMQRNIAAALAISPRVVSVKATTTEGLGTVGRGEGAACMAIALIDEH
jgi:2-C-methyl-D-erythritol 2,4-cyclodiphosphate synthase